MIWQRTAAVSKTSHRNVELKDGAEHAAIVFEDRVANTFGTTGRGELAPPLKDFVPFCGWSPTQPQSEL